MFPCKSCHLGEIRGQIAIFSPFRQDDVLSFTTPVTTNQFLLHNKRKVLHKKRTFRPKSGTFFYLSCLTWLHRLRLRLNYTPRYQFNHVKYGKECSHGNRKYYPGRLDQTSKDITDKGDGG